MSKRVYILLADGFEEAEAVTPWDILKRAGAKVTLVSVSGNKTVTGSHGLEAVADIPLSCATTGFDMVVLPGGKGGTENLLESEGVKNLLIHAFNGGKYIAAICAAPSVLGKYGLLKGRKATCFPGWEDMLEGAVLTEDKVIKDGNIITAKGMGVAFEFGIALAEVLAGRETAENIKVQTQHD